VISQNHIIYRQVLEISFLSREEAVRAQDEISSLYRHELVPLILEIFDSLPLEEEHLRIPRLEIDLGALSSQSLKEDFLAGIRENLAEALIKSVQGTARNRYNTEALLHSHTDLPEEPSVRSADRSDLDLFVFFLKTGHLPWWAGTAKSRSMEELALQLLDAKSESLVKALRNLVIHERYRHRLIQQFPDEILTKILQIADRNRAGTIAKLHEELYAVHRIRTLAPLSRSNFRLLLWQCAFEWLMAHSIGRSGEKWADADLDRMLKADPGSVRTGPSYRSGTSEAAMFRPYLFFIIRELAAKRGAATGGEASKRSGNEGLNVIRALLHDDEGRKGPSFPLLSAILGVSRSGDAEAESVVYRALRSAEDDDPSLKIDGNETGKTEDDVESETRRLLDSEDAFFVENAGLAILAPFLPTFFDSLGLVSEKRFVTTEASWRAALLLQYTVTKETEFPEHELLLNKLLCGLPVDEPLARSVDLSEIEKEEVENLLSSVVAHWEVLKGTSIEGLRQTFLNREGILSEDSNGWRLRVERTGVDVLLDRLPWGISVLRLPWNDYMIHVEW